MSEDARLTPAQRLELESLMLELPVSSTLERHLSEVAITCVVGPSAIGKDTVIGLTGLPQVKGKTTRPTRGEGDLMECLVHTPAVVDDTIDKARAGELVQVSIGPQDFLYWTDPDDYASGCPNIADLGSSNILFMRTRPFGSQCDVVMVGHSSDWIERFTQNRGDLAVSSSRLKWDYNNLKLALEGESFIPLVNEKDYPEKTAIALRHIAESQGQEVRATGEAQLIGKVLLGTIAKYIDHK